jgi:hypothetical protein
MKFDPQPFIQMKALSGFQNLSSNGKPKVVISGCGRSGTLYMQYVMEAFGLQVGHEGFLADGISSWYIAQQARAKIVKSAMEHFKKVVYIHLVREPLEAIASMWRCENLQNRSALDFFRKHCPNYQVEYDRGYGDPLYSAAYWFIWNRMVESEFPDAWRVRVEDVATREFIDEFSHRSGMPYSEKTVSQIQSLGNRTHEIPEELMQNLKDYMPELCEPLTYERLQKLSPSIAKKIKAMARRYNYFPSPVSPQSFDGPSPPESFG